MHRFVRESQTTIANVAEKPKKHSIAIADGQTARIEYERILEMPQTAPMLRADKATQMTITRSRKKVTVPFDKNRLFHAATTNDVLTIEQMHLPSTPNSVNATDQFGWTGLMMAAYEGHLDVTKVLLRLGADLHVKNNKNETALILADRAKRHGVVKFLKESLEPICLSSDDDAADDDDDNNGNRTHFCDICQMNVAKGDRKSHETSTLHRFNRTDAPSTAHRFGIPDTNVGFQMLLQQGWNRERGLGAEQNGIIYPIKTTLRKPRSGLGVRQCSKAKITHFKPFDRDAIKSIVPLPLPTSTSTKTKRQLRTERQRTQRKDRYLRKLLS